CSRNCRLSFIGRQQPAPSRSGLLCDTMRRRTVNARVHLLLTSEGGRCGPLASGYRSLLRFEGSDMDFGFELELDTAITPNGLAPGSSGTGRLSFWAIKELPSLFAGQRFELREGTRIVGHGNIIDSDIS